MVAPATSAGVPDIYGTPAGFAEGILGLELYDWQRRLLNELEQPGMVSTVCCNESGKTTYVAAPAIAWVLGCFPGSQAVVTSGSWRQVKHQLFPAFKRFSAQLPGWQIDDTVVKTPHGSRAVGFSTDDAGLFEGFHVGPGGHRETPLLIIVDEAKSVAEGIFQAIDRCRPTWLLLLSSPGAARGVFYKSHTSLASHYRRHKVPASLCPHIDQAILQSVIARYGNDHPFVRSSIYAEFDDEGGPGVIISRPVLEACLGAHIASKHGDRIAWCDFAGGRDENVLAVADGNRCWIEAAWRDTDTMRACGEFIAHFRRLGLRAEHITGDGDGMGQVMMDRMAELGWRINRFHGGAPANEPKTYANQIAEVWGEAAVKISRRQVILPPDAILHEQMVDRVWKRFSDGTLLLESKDDMRKEGRKSPDRADAILGVISKMQQVSRAAKAWGTDTPQPSSDYAQGGALAGMCAGM